MSQQADLLQSHNKDFQMTGPQDQDPLKLPQGQIKQPQAADQIRKILATNKFQLLGLIVLVWERIGQDFFGQTRRAEGEDSNGIPFTWDKATDRRIRKLHPDARQVVADFINFSAEQGYYLRVTETYRTVQRQNELYAKGRTVIPPNGTVTKARGLPKSSIHQYGIAFDCVEIAKGKDNRNNGKRFSTPGIGSTGFDKAYPKNRWQEIGAIGKQFGFVWGGNFRGFFDGPHFEVFRASASELRRKEARGQVVVDPNLGPNYKYPKF